MEQENKALEEVGQMEEKLVDPAVQEKEMRSGINRFGLMMVAATAIYIAVSVLFTVLAAVLEKKTNLSKELIFAFRLLPNYLITMPLIIELLRFLPGTELERRKLPFKSLLCAIAMTFGIMVACNLIGLVLMGIIGSIIGTEVSNVTMEILNESNLGASVIFISICAPIFEELIFRKMLVTRTVKYGEGVAVLLSGLMFGLFHGNLNQFAYTFGIGAFFAYLYIKTGNIKITMALHVMINFCSSVVLTGLMKLADFDTMTRLSVAARETGDMTAVVEFTQTHLVPMLLLYGYLFLEYGLAIAGVILLIVLHKKMKLSQREYAFSKGKKAALMFGNVGMILYCGFWVVRIILQLFGI